MNERKTARVGLYQSETNNESVRAEGVQKTAIPSIKLPNKNAIMIA